MKLQLPNKVYDALKWVLLIAVPAFISLFTTLAKVWNWDIPLEAIIATITAFATFIGALIGISSINYKKNNR